MEKILKLYTYVDGTNDTPFPSADEQVIIGSFTYTANRMGSAPQIAATVKHRLCLDDIWNDKVYAEFNGEKYFVINTPSSSKSNDDTRYEHDLELLSEREILNHVYFIDAVQGDSDTDVYKSNSTKVLFYGDIQQFVARLNASLSYRNLGYTAVIDDGVTSEDKQVSFEDKYILEALQEEFNIFEIPYYFVGKVIHFGYTSNAITTTFKYGHDDAFLSISKDNANYALINRITGVGSSDNIPYYYPNETDDQSAVEASGKKWITPSQNLMPSIYRESEGAEMFYEAKNNTYPDGEGGYYEFENEYSENNPREGITDFENIKPTITGTTNAAGQRIDMFSEFAYDTNDSDEVDEEGNYLHPYFFAKLRKTDGTYGFNLFDHAIESQTMQITFTSGICGACTFEIAVGEDTQKNLVQVGETSGALMRDEDGNVLCGREDLQQPQTPQDRQNDTRNYEVWIALRKDNSTYPQVMPNVNYNYKPSTSDTFAILGISLPQAYILKAEDELEKSLVKHMWMNNVEKFTFSAKFSRIFFTEHPEVLAQLNENARVLIEYNGKQHTLYIDNYTYKMDSGSPLPEIDIDLVDTLSVGQNSLQTQLDSIKQDILSSVGGADFLKQGLKYFLRKDTSDTARGKITFVRGLDVGTFAENTSGGTFRVLEDLTTYAEIDRLRVRVKAYFETLEIINTNSVGGKMILTAGGGVYLREVKDRETLEDGTEQVWDFYRCYFLTEQDGREVENRFHVGDLAMSQSFNIKAGTHQGVTNHYYWREVVGIGDDYIDLSKTICDTGSDAPMAEDTVCHLGNRSDKDRQGAIIFSAVDVFSPSITLYYGINDFSLVNKDYVSYGVDKSTGNAFFRVYGEMYAGDREQTSYVKYTPGVGVEMRGKFLNQAGESYDTIIDSIQNAIDGNIETWFGEEKPTLSNEPAVNWTTDEDKNTHLGDLYYSDAGVAYRFQMEGAQYVWKMLKDSDITKALADAKAAKDAADAAQEAADAAADRLTAWASDGVISPTEKQGIKDEIARIDADKANITAQYTKYGLGTPTAFNKAYTAYRAVLVSLSASTPENIAIPSDFSSKQTYYYNERTSALGAIADASITSVNNVTEQLEQMQQDFAEVKQDVAGVKTSVDGLKNFTDEAFADGIVDRNESAAIASHINSIETFAKDAAESYTKVYENTLLTGTAKTNLANAYTAFTTAKTELVTTINGAIADGLVDALEKSAVDGKYTAFNTKYGDFVANLNAANRAIQDAINQNALQALQKIGELDYLKAALKEFTTIEGGLIQSSTLALGYTSDSGYQVMAGTNGIYDASKLGGGIASWWGGAMFDRFEYTEETMPKNVASALVRMDGTGYFAKGNLWWESDGTLHADPLSFFVGEDSVGDVLGLFQFVKSDAGVEYVIPQHPFQKLEIGNYLQIGKAQLYWDEANQAFYVRHQDGVSPVGFYATGFISTKGANPDAGGVVSGASKLTELEDVSVSSAANGQVLTWDVSSKKWVNKTIEAGLDTAELEEYLTSHDYAKKSDIPALTGYATQEWVNTKLGSYATTSAMNSALGNKVDKVAGKGLSSNDFTDALLTKLNGIEEGANKYVLPTATGSVLGGVKVGATLAIASGVLNMKTVGTAGTYTKVTVDAYGRVTGHASLAATDIPNLPWSKITSGKPTTLAGYGITDAYTKTESDGRYVNVSGDTMTGNLTLKPLGGPWLNGKTQAPIMTNGASSTTGSTYHPIIWGKTDAGDVWNLGHGASGQVGFFGFYSERTANGTDWSTYIKVSTGVFYQSKAMNVTGLITATAGLTTPQYIQIGSGRIKWDSSNNALYVEKSDGTAIGFYSKGFISTKGANDDAGGSVSGVTELSQLSDVTLGTLANGQALVWDSTLQKWVNKTIESGLDETALAQYLTNNQYLTMPTGDARYVNLTGDTMSGTLTISTADLGTQLIINRNNATSLPAITYKNTSGILGRIGVGGSGNGNAAGQPCFSPGTSTTLYPILTSNNYTSYIGNSFVKKSGDTMTGSLTLNTTGLNAGINIGGISITRQDDNTGLAILNTNGIIRFGDKNWDFSHWAGLRYVHSNKYLYLGIADGSVFTANAAQSGGSIITPGISNIFVGNNTTNKVWHAGNDGSGSGLDADMLDGKHAGTALSQVTVNFAFPGYSSFGDASDNASYYTNIEKWIQTNYSGNEVIFFGKGVPNSQGVLIGHKYSEAGNSAGFPKYCSFLYSSLGGVVYTFGIHNYSQYSYQLARTVDNVASATQLQTARTINGTAFNGTSNIVTSYWGTARTLSLTGNATGSVSMNGSSNVSMSVNVNYASSAGNASTLGGTSKAGLFTALSSSNATNLSVTIGGTTKSITDLYANYAVSAAILASQGRNTAITGKPTNSGMQMFEVYSNGYPCSYGNVLRVKGASSSGSGELLLGWSGTSNAVEHIYYRNNRDSVTTWSEWRTLAFTTDNVASATKLQTARNIWGQSFNGTANVSGNMTGVGSITASSSITITSNGYFITKGGWFQNSTSGVGLYNSAQDARWYATSSGWISDKKINANAGLGVSGTTTLGAAVQVPYVGSSWISMATRTNLIYSTTNNSTDSAHALYRVKANNGNALCFGGLGNNLGFYAFTAANISSSTNVVWKNTYWNMTNWTLTHGGVLHCTGGIYSDSYVSAKGQNQSSDERLKNIIERVYLDVRLIAKAPSFRFSWKDGTGIDVGSSAQYWKNILPDAVKERNGFYEMAYGNIALISAISIAKEVEKHSNDIRKLKMRVKTLEEENKILKKRLSLQQMQ